MDNDRPCPFCGSDDLLLVRGHEGAVYWFECQNCLARGPQGSLLEPASTLWNNRHGDAVAKWIPPLIELAWGYLADVQRIAEKRDLTKI